MICAFGLSAAIAMAILFATTSPRLSSIVRANQHSVDEFAGHFLGRVLQDLAGLQNSHFHLRTHGVSAHGQQHLLLLKVCCLLIKDSVNAPGEDRTMEPEVLTGWDRDPKDWFDLGRHLGIC